MKNYIFYLYLFDMLLFNFPVWAKKEFHWTRAREFPILPHFRRFSFQFNFASLFRRCLNEKKYELDLLLISVYSTLTSFYNKLSPKTF